MKSTLTTEETKWLKKLQRVLNECPGDRLQFYVTGGREMHAFDGTKMNEIDAVLDAGNNKMDFCQAVALRKADLMVLELPCDVHSTAG